MATGGNLEGSDEIITFKCCVCIQKNITKDAEKYCVECQDYYCIPCTDSHKMFPAMSGHQILDKADFSSHGRHQNELPSLPTERCSTHSTKLLDMFCANHNEVTCASCVALNHRSCQDIQSIPENVDHLYKQSTYEESKKKLNVMKRTMEDIKKTKESLIRDLKKWKKEATDSIRKLRKEMEAVLEKLEKESIQELEAEYEKVDKELNKLITEAETFTADLAQYSKKLEDSAGNKAQAFVCVKQAEKIIGKAEESEKCLREEQNVELEFQADFKIKIFLEQLKTLGQVSFTRPKDKPRTTVYKMKKQKEINVKLQNDPTKCCIYGSCFTTDGNLLLTDYNNRRLKHVDISTATVKDHLDLSTGPFAVCLTGEDEAAVSLDNKNILFVSLGDLIVAIRQIYLGHHCLGLAYTDGKLFISDFKKSVYIHDIYGTLITKVTTDRSGNDVFANSRHICVSSYRDRVYVADLQKGLIALDKQGNYISTFTDPDLGQPWGVCTDRRENIFVCGISSNVIQINEDCIRKVGTLGNMIYYHSTCFDPQQDNLVLTSDTVTIYQLE